MHRWAITLLAAAVLVTCAVCLLLRWGQLASREPCRASVELARLPNAAHVASGAVEGSVLEDAAVRQSSGVSSPPPASSRHHAPEDAPHTYAVAGRPGSAPAESGAASGQPAPGHAAKAQSSAGSLVNINTAGAPELATLPGIGEVLAARIVAYRQAHGLFKSVDGLLAVEGIGAGKLAKLKPQATVGK